MPSPVSRTRVEQCLKPRFCHEFLLGFAYHTCPARRASYYPGHSTAVRVCCSHLCLVFISPIAVLCILELTTLSLLYPRRVRSCPSTAHRCVSSSVLPPSLRRRNSSSPQSTSLDPPILRITDFDIASFWEPGVRSRPALENHCAAFDEGSPTNGTPFRYPPPVHFQSSFQLCCPTPPRFFAFIIIG